MRMMAPGTIPIGHHLREYPATFTNTRLGPASCLAPISQPWMAHLPAALMTFFACMPSSGESMMITSAHKHLARRWHQDCLVIHGGTGSHDNGTMTSQTVAH